MLRPFPPLFCESVWRIMFRIYFYLFLNAIWFKRGGRGKVPFSFSRQREIERRQLHL